MPNIVPPNPTQPVVSDDGTMRLVFQTWTQQVTQNDLLIGIGSPEGSVDALPGRMYMDSNGAAGSILYIKRDSSIAGDTTQGWILV